MKLEELKRDIENNTVTDNLLIFKCDIRFIPLQYVHEIGKIKNKNITFVDTIEEFPHNTSNLFGFVDDNLYVYVCDKLDKLELTNYKNCVIICEKIDKSINSDYVINVPKLEQWQVKDYVYSICDGVDSRLLDKLIEICNYDIYRLDNEIQKLLAFNSSDRNIILSEMFDSGSFYELIDYTIWNLSNAIIKKDINSLSAIYEKLPYIDVEPVGLVTVLYNNFKNILQVQLGKNVTAETLGISSKQFWAVKNYNINYYTKEQLIDIFLLITNMDKLLKTGKLKTDLFIDYMITKIITF